MAISTTTTLDPKLVASRCLEAWSTGDFDAARALLDEHVQFTGPLGHTEGADDYIEGVRGLAQSLKGIEQRRIFGEGDDVCIVYDLVTKTKAGSVPTAGWYRVRHGRIVSICAFFDARALVSYPTESGSGAKPG